MKRHTVVGAAVSWALFSSAALAAPNVVNTNQKGSLLIFPEIDISEPDDEDNDGSKNTIIRITNDNTGKIDVKCYYGEFTDELDRKPTRDFQFKLTKNQPAYWEVKDGTGTITAPNFNIDMDSGENAGQLICWAVSKGGGTQVKWNHLAGTAMIVDTSDNTSHTYNAYQFYARGAKNKQQVGSTAGILELDGTAAGGGYDKCGRYLIGQFSPRGARIELPDDDYDLYVENNFLSISSCTQDLSPVGNAKPLGPDSSDPFADCDPDTATSNPKPRCGHDIVFDVWNEDEVKFTGARERADSWWRMDLGSDNSKYSEIENAPENFTFDQLQTDSAYFRAESDSGYGLVGVLVTDYDNPDDNGCGESCRSVDTSAVTLHHAGTRAGIIKWRTQYDDPPEKR